MSAPDGSLRRRGDDMRNVGFSIFVPCRHFGKCIEIGHTNVVTYCRGSKVKRVNIVSIRCRGRSDPSSMSEGIPGAYQEGGGVVNEVGDNRFHKVLREPGDW